MINKRELFRKLKKNKFLVLAISVIVITGIYYGAQKAIDSYNFKSNGDWDEFEEGEVTKDNAGAANDSGKVPEDEVDLELEETVEDAKDVEENRGQEEEGSSGTEEKIYVYITGEVNVPRCCNFK